MGAPTLDDLSSDRQRRLFACACCRSIWHLLRDERSRRAVEVAERFADGLASDAEVYAANFAAWEVLVGSDEERQRRREAATVAAAGLPAGAPPPLDPDALALHNGGATNPAAAAGYVAAHAEARSVLEAAELVLAALDLEADGSRTSETEAEWQRAALTDIVGAPASPFAFLAEWRTDTSVAVARQMYESREFGAMPILADALQDAGCEDAHVLAHCRAPGPHVRGCWVVDFVLGCS